jgi:ribosomal protein S18 acetylase RimI-like enzyme
MDTATVQREAEAPTSASAGDIEEAADTLAAAFVADPIFAWFMREDALRADARRRFFRVILREVALPDGEISRPLSGGAAAVWIPSERLGGQPISRELRALPMLLNATGFRRFGRLTVLRKAMDEKHPMDRPHDYLWFLGVRPDLQGLGIGSRLLAARTRDLDRRGRCAFLETATARNLTLYHRHGFEIIDDYCPGADGPRIWTLWRDPRAPVA